jgi:hypothetical protein
MCLKNNNKKKKKTIQIMGHAQSIVERKEEKSNNSW